MKLIERTTYLSEMLELADTPDIKVITGVRRSGKSKLMEALAQEIVERQPDANIIHINYNLTDFESIMEYRSMEAYVEERYAPNRQNYLFIDEVQMCASFEKAIKQPACPGKVQHIHHRVKRIPAKQRSGNAVRGQDVRDSRLPVLVRGVPGILPVSKHLRQPDRIHLGWGDGGLVSI